MIRRIVPIVYKDFRPLGIGRLTCCDNSTSDLPGILVGSSKGLYHLADPEAKPHRVRRFPVEFMISGDTGMVCHEETKTQGRLAVLNSQLEELKTDPGLARTINPVAYWNNGIVIFHQENFVWLDPVSSERRPVAKFVPVHTMTPFAPVEGGYEFIAAHREPDWPAYLCKLYLPLAEGLTGKVEELGRLEDPVMSRHFMKLTETRFLVIPQGGKPIFLILRRFVGDEPSIRTWELVQVSGGAHPVGMVRRENNLYAAIGENLCTFELSEEFALGEPE